MGKEKRRRVEEYLINQKDILTILPFERKLGFKRGTIYKFINNSRKLRLKEIEIIDRYILDIINKYLDEEID